MVTFPVASRHWSTAGSVAFAVLLWLSFFHLPRMPMQGLDPSWVVALGHSFEHGWLVGRDYVFTHGPLGFLTRAVGIYNPALFVLQLACKAVLASLFTFVFVAQLRRIPGTVHRIAAGLVLAVVVSQFGDPLYFLALTTGALLVIASGDADGGSRATSWTVWAAVAALFGMLGLGKFSNLLAIAAFLPPVTVAVALGRSKREAIVWLAFVSTSFLLLWFGLAGQTAGNVWPFLFHSFDLTAGYSNAMGFAGPPIELLLAAVGAASFAVLLALPGPGVDRMGRALGTVVLAAGLFLSWKAGFVRHDSHSTTFFCFVALAPLLSCTAAAAGRVRLSRDLLLTLTLAVSMAGLFNAKKRFEPTTFVAHWASHVASNARALADPLRLWSGYEGALVGLRARVDLPEMRSAIGDASVDLLTEEQIVPILNGFNWLPRPVFQSHAAFTPGLVTLNAQHYGRIDAPEFVIVMLDTIDARLPMGSDAETLRIVRYGYAPVLVERGMLLMKRTARPAPMAPPFATTSGPIRFDEWIAVDDPAPNELSLRLDIESTLRGRMVGFVYRLASVRLELETTDGEVHSFRIGPGTSGEEFLVSPLVTSQSDLVDLFSGRVLRSVRRLRVSVDPAWQTGWFRREIRAIWVHRTAPRGPPPG